MFFFFWMFVGGIRFASPVISMASEFGIQELDDLEFWTVYKQNEPEERGGSSAGVHV